MENSQRDISFDVCKALLIILVILGHFLQESIRRSDLETSFVSSIYYLLYSFHMPAFMFISGWFSYGKQISLKSYIYNTFLYLLIPLIFWDLVLCVIDIALGTFNGISSLLISLWYIKALILIRFCTWPFIKKTNFLTGVMVFFIGIICGQYYLLSLLVPSFLIGYLFRKFQLFNYRFILPISLIAFLIELILIHPYIESSKLNIVNNFNFSSIVNYLNRLFIGISGTIFFICTIRKLSRLKLEKLASIGRITLGIYILQSIIAERFLCKVSNMIDDVFIYLVMSIFTTIICCIIILPLRKIKCVQLLFGR